MVHTRRTLVIDCRSAGVSGDMFIGALIDLGASVKRVVVAMTATKDYVEGCDNLDVEVEDVVRHGLAAKKVTVKPVESVGLRSGLQIMNAVEGCMRDLEIPGEGLQFACAAARTLVEAESKLHGKRIEDIHLHGLGSVDTVADIVGTTIALEDLDLFRNVSILSTPLAVGGGPLELSHGCANSPGAATLEILRSKRFPFLGGPVEAELATPTGSSLLVNLAKSWVQYYPSLIPHATGYGAGCNDFTEMSNVLRLTMGELVNPTIEDEVFVMETNLDDVTGENIGYVFERIMRAGAKDMCTIPMLTKKNRPGLIIKVIADRASVNTLAEILIKETGALGVRLYPCERKILPRETISVKICLGGIEAEVRVKVSRDGNGKVVRIKPESDDIAHLAEKTDLPYISVQEAVVKEVDKTPT